jgi:hypothetical protein
VPIRPNLLSIEPTRPRRVGARLRPDAPPPSTLDRHGLRRAVPPPGSPAEFFAEIANSIGNSAAQIPAQFSGKKKWWEILLAPFLAAAYALVTFFKLVTLPGAALARLLTSRRAG